MLAKRITSENHREQLRKVVCSHCNVITNHKVHARIKLSWEEPEYSVQGIDIYETISCLGCEEISFRLTSSNTDNVDFGEEGEMIYIETEAIYPNRLMGRSPLQEMYSLPEKIRNIYKETHSALTSRLKILASVGIRALVEAVCIEEKADGINLEKKIDSLVVKGVLTSGNASILHKTRFLGNRSAHEIEAATDVELEIAFDIIENLLKTIYIIPKKAQNLSV